MTKKKALTKNLKKKKEQDKPGIPWYIIISLLVLPPVLSLLYIINFGVNVCYADQWVIVPLFDKFFTGQLSLNDLFAFHNEHRILFPRIIMLFLGLITHYNNIAEMLLSWAFLILIAFILFKVYCKYFGFSKNSMLKFIPVIWLVFSLRQWQNLLWGFQLAWFVVVLFILLSLYFLDKRNNLSWQFAVAIVCGIIASFSSIQGLLIWPVGFVYIIISNLSKTMFKQVSLVSTASAWFIAGIAVFLIYFYGSNLFLSGISQAGSRDIATMVSYFIVAVGSVFSVNITICIICGILIIAVCIACIVIIFNMRDLDKRKIAFGTSLVLFAFLFAIILAIGRSGFGTAHAQEARYVTNMTQGVIGIYFILLSFNVRHNQYKSYLYPFFVIIISLAMVYVYSTSYIIGPFLKAPRVYVMNVIKTFEKQSDEELKVVDFDIDAKTVRERAQILKKYGLNVFSK